MPIRLIGTLLTLAQLLIFAAPVQAQGLPNFWPSPGTGGYYNGTGGVYVPRLIGGPQYGYSAASRYRMPSNGMGMALGLGMYGGMMGVGSVMMASQMMARRNMNKQNNPSNPPKDKAAKLDRRQKQELALKGQLDNDYQKELAEKGLTPATAPMPGSPRSFAPPASGGQQFAPGGQAMSQNPQPSLSPAFNQPANQPAAGFAGGAAGSMTGPGASPAGEVLNPTPWTPTADPSQPSF
jgi:hypothetical protein